MPHPKATDDPTFTENQLPERTRKVRIKKTPIIEHSAQAHIPEGTERTAIGLWKLFFSDEILQAIVDHTNEYAEQQITLLPPRHRSWKSLNLPEFHAFLAVQIYMGLHCESDVEDYWNTNPVDGPLHLEVTKHIALGRFQQIDRFLHVSPPCPPGQRQSAFEKVEPLSTYLLARCKQLYTPHTHLAVDEVMVRFTGRSYATVKLPNMPIPEGYKIWVIAADGYIIQWLYHTKEKHGLDPQWGLEPYNFSKTEAVVLTLAQRFKQTGDFSYVIWLDNLFTSSRLLLQLKAEGYGAGGTVRKTDGRGLHQDLIDLKNDFADSVGWGTSMQ